MISAQLVVPNVHTLMIDIHLNKLLLLLAYTVAKNISTVSSFFNFNFLLLHGISLCARFKLLLRPN